MHLDGRGRVTAQVGFDDPEANKNAAAATNRWEVGGEGKARQTTA